MTNYKMCQSFCLGCGKPTGIVRIPITGYSPFPDVAVPSWCLNNKCQEQRKKFNDTAKKILDPNSTKYVA